MTSPRRVLLIDDDRFQYRLTLQQFSQFTASDYILEWSETYEEGLEKLLHEDYTACLLDYRLGARDGLELIREAMKRGCRVPIIFLTAETGANVDIEAMNAGALDYLVKGEISPPMLERSLRYALKLGDTLEALRQLATRDELTGLLNRRVFDSILKDEMERSLRFDHAFAMILMDIDHFKSVNDTHGHLAGDAVLRELAKRLQTRVRSVDRVTRYGGEEFAILLLEGDTEQAVAMAEKLREIISSEPVTIGPGLKLTITVSAGVAVFPRDGCDASGIIAAADRALYAAKENGRNQVVRFADLPKL